MQSDIGPATDEGLEQDTKSERFRAAEACITRPRAERTTRRDSAAGHIDLLRRRVYDLSDLSAYTTRDRLIIKAADLCLYLAIGVICSSLRWEVRGCQHLDSIADSGKRAIFTFWHSCIFSATWFWRNRGIVVMSSVSRDAEYTARVIKRFGYGAARGSSTRGGGRALAEMAQCLDNGMEVAFTIDGPRGPAYKAKPGAVTLARHSGHAILPFHIATRRHVELPSWDRLKVPLPFSRALTLIAEPIYVPRTATSEQIAVAQAHLQSALDNLRSEGDAWRTQQ